MVTATGLPPLMSSSFRMYAKLSSWLHSAHVRISVYPHMASSCRSMSLTAFTGVSPPTVDVFGTTHFMLLYPYAIATSSTTSQGCSTSERVTGTLTCTLLPSAPTDERSIILFSSVAIVGVSSSIPALRLMYSVGTVICLSDMSGNTCTSPKASTTSTGSTSNAFGVQYSLNIAHTVFSVTFALVRSVAVHSMNTSVVSSVIWLGDPLMMGGSDSTVLFAS
mmetsp:Transcript_6665/g.17331  ORF Transcript_6665/g.17331 Transcript_6665/m.17331 type:complete len:221 (-) Transcript_6665:707-1369(-)